MKRNIGILFFAFLLISCKDNSALTYSEQTFEQKSNLDCSEFCPVAKLEIIHFENTKTADSINNKVFSAFKEIVSFEEEPQTASNYEELLNSFISSYEKLKTEFPEETISWEATGKSEVSYQNEKIINIKIEYYIFTGGAHGYSGTKSLVFDLKNGKTLNRSDIFSDVSGFTAFAEKKFREKFNIKLNVPINATIFMFENEFFELPETILFTKKGLLLFYNTYEIASYADGPQELIISYEEVKPFLKVF